MLRLSHLGLQCPLQDQYGEPTDFNLSKAVAGELIWNVVNLIGLTDREAVLLFWGVKSILQDEKSSAVLRDAIWRGLIKIRDEGASIEGDQKELVEELVLVSIFFFIDYEERKAYKAKPYFLRLIKGLPGQNAAIRLAAIGYKFGLTSL